MPNMRMTYNATATPTATQLTPTTNTHRMERFRIRKGMGRRHFRLCEVGSLAASRCVSKGRARRPRNFEMPFIKSTFAGMRVRRCKDAPREGGPRYRRYGNTAGVGGRTGLK